MFYDGGFPEYVSVAEKRARAKREAAQLAKRGQRLEPVVIAGRKIAETFWGKAWCDHFEKYSDYASRLPRGRSYARNGAVIDLKISAGKIDARVSGTELYESTVEIREVPKKKWQGLAQRCTGGIDTLIELLSGKLSDQVMNVLCEPTTGLFPDSREIELSCSCPDGARLCKHLAAVLYGVGARLDHKPELLFVLRGVDPTELVTSAGTKNALALPESGSGTSDAELASLFGIELADAPEPKGKPRAQRAPKATPAKNTVTSADLKALGLPSKQVRAGVKLGMLVPTPERGVYRKTRATMRWIAQTIDEAAAR